MNKTDEVAYIQAEKKD